jgi:hypothetical protein
MIYHNTHRLLPAYGFAPELYIVELQPVMVVVLGAALRQRPSSILARSCAIVVIRLVAWHLYGDLVSPLLCLFNWKWG